MRNFYDEHIRMLSDLLTLVNNEKASNVELRSGLSKAYNELLRRPIAVSIDRSNHLLETIAGERDIIPDRIMTVKIIDPYGVEYTFQALSEGFTSGYVG